jgi:molybdenum cofactor cytidylyltransferase
VAFAGHLGRELMALQGDIGARGVVAAHSDRLRLLPVDDAGVLADIDIPDELNKHFPPHRPA